MIALMIGNGNPSVRRMSMSDRQVVSFIDEHGPAEALATGFVFSTYQWRTTGSGDRLVVIDQGAKRIVLTLPA